MINASAEFIELCQGHGRKWQKILSNEREHRQRLEDMVEQLAKQHSHLENMVRKEIEHHDSEINATNNRYNFSSNQIWEVSSPQCGKCVKNTITIFT